MPDGAHKGSFVQAYNTQIVVDSQAQIIVAAEVTQETNDKQQLAPMLAQVEQNLGAKPEAASADTGYWSEAQLNDQRLKGIELYVATGKQKHGEVEGERPPGTEEPGTSPREKMKQKLESEGGRDIYRMRKAIVEPVFGQIKEWRRFSRFSLRGESKVRAEMEVDLPDAQSAQAVPVGLVVPYCVRRRNRPPGRFRALRKTPGLLRSVGKPFLSRFDVRCCTNQDAAS